jgi:type II restriction enzyme
MSQHELLRQRIEQHKIKNTISKIDDENIKNVAKECCKILQELYPQHSFTLHLSLTFSEIEDYNNFSKNTFKTKHEVRPDGGVIWMDNKYPVLISEMKKQGTNDEREKEGKKKQAVGNAIERYGKNLMAFHTLYNKEDILPVIAFCHGCDFLSEIVLAKLYTLNGFHECNKVYDQPTKERIKPSTILYQLDNWTGEQMLLPMLQIASGAIEYYINK